MTDALHAPCAPSSMARTMQCPGSVTLQVQFPDQGDDTASREGTAAHEVVARTLAGEIVPAGAVAATAFVSRRLTVNVPVSESPATAPCTSTLTSPIFSAE